MPCWPGVAEVIGGMGIFGKRIRREKEREKERKRERKREKERKNDRRISPSIQIRNNHVVEIMGQ